MHVVLGAVTVLLVAAAAAPVVMVTCGLTSFDLPGNFGTFSVGHALGQRLLFVYRALWLAALASSVVAREHLVRAAAWSWRGAVHVASLLRRRRPA